jgi:maleate cis-trans isomerase
MIYCCGFVTNTFQFDITERVKSAIKAPVTKVSGNNGGGNMAIRSWRGDIATIKPTVRPDSGEFMRLLPRGVGVMELGLGISRGTEDEFKNQLDAYEACIAELAPRGPAAIFPGGAPPFMVHGFKGEAKIVRAWEKRYKIPIITSGQLQVRAFKAVGAKSIMGATYFPPHLNDIFARYYTDAGFEVRAMEGIDVPFDKVQTLSGESVYAHIKKTFLKSKGADIISMLGSGWSVIDIIQTIEQDLGVPVIHPVCAKVWEVQHRLHIREKITGHGVLLAELPKG